MIERPGSLIQLQTHGSEGARPASEGFILDNQKTSRWKDQALLMDGLSSIPFIFVSQLDDFCYWYLDSCVDHLYATQITKKYSGAICCDLMVGCYKLHRCGPEKLQYCNCIAKKLKIWQTFGCSIPFLTDWFTIFRQILRILKTW